MLGSTLKHQSNAVTAIADVDGFDAFALCHDTFQYFRARDTGFYPEHVGLVHVSGITRTDLEREELTEPDRGLVDARIAETMPQLRWLEAAGYRGYVSLEPFDPAVQTDPALAPALEASIAYMSAA